MYYYVLNVKQIEEIFGMFFRIQQNLLPLKISCISSEAIKLCIGRKICYFPLNSIKIFQIFPTIEIDIDIEKQTKQFTSDNSLENEIYHFSDNFFTRY